MWTLTVAADGHGTVTSTPPGIACPGACSASFPAGTPVALTAAASASDEFVAWSGACAGTSGCSLTMAGDATVTAKFADPCAGLVPQSLPTPQTATVRAQGGFDPTWCGSPTADGAGNLYLFGEGGFFATLQSGYTFFTQQMVTSGWFIAAAPDGTGVSSTPILTDTSAAGLQANGGVVLALADCRGGNAVHLRRIDGMGRVTNDVALAGEHCPAAFAAVAIDAQDRTILLSNSPDRTTAYGHTAARWFDAAGQPVTDWFDAGPIQDEWFIPGWTGELFALIDGGVALRTPRNDWIATIASGKAAVGPPPAGFKPNARAQVVMGGKAYAFSSGSKIDFVSARGRSCGSLAVPGTPASFDIGRDGSIVEVGTRNNEPTCTVTYYPQALK